MQLHTTPTAPQFLAHIRRRYTLNNLNTHYKKRFKEKEASKAHFNILVHFRCKLAIGINIIKGINRFHDVVNIFKHIIW